MGQSHSTSKLTLNYGLLQLMDHLLATLSITVSLTLAQILLE